MRKVGNLVTKVAFPVKLLSGSTNFSDSQIAGKRCGRSHGATLRNSGSNGATTPVGPTPDWRATQSRVEPVLDGLRDNTRPARM